MTILLTGAAGFIGFHTAKALAARGERVVGVDNLNAYYDPALKDARLAELANIEGFSFEKADIADAARLVAIAREAKVDRIVHLAAQAGVRYSLENPFAYVESNLTGHVAVLEAARAIAPQHTVYASSSSVYGGNTKAPFAETDVADDPVSLYGATKKSDELLSQSYARLYGLTLTGLRFFTVYGPWGRPDMAYWIFAERIAEGRPIDVFNEGRMARDFTYIDDIVAGVLAALDHPPADRTPPHRVYNLGNDRPEALTSLIEAVETAMGAKAEKVMKPMQPGDVERTWADISRAREELGYAPKTALKDGIAAFAEWYLRWRRRNES